MSILIKGMEMPKNCFDCPCVDAEFMECAAKEHLSLPKDKYGAVLGDVPNWCPLVPVPPHGRLIDADKLNALVYANIALFDSAPGRMGAEQKVVRAWLASMVDDIDDAPTIIPAEEGE